MKGTKAGFEFFTGYLIEQSLSVDNMFAFFMMFDYFKVPLQHQNRVLTWGIWGALILRGIMISIGVAFIHRFKGIALIFASILLFSCFKLLFEKEDDGQEDLSNNFVLKIVRRIFPNTTDSYDGDNFLNSNRQATPLFVCLVAIEISDLVFAVDSIPAVLGVCTDPLVVYSSNIFAILALRSLYTIISKAVSELKYLKPAVALVLGFIGCKMIAEYFRVTIGIDLSLVIVCAILGSGVVASALERRNNITAEYSAGKDHVDEENET